VTHTVPLDEIAPDLAVQAARVFSEIALWFPAPCPELVQTTAPAPTERTPYADELPRLRGWFRT
jgi:hypothetical protein